MLIVMKAHASEEQVQRVCKKVESLGLRAHAIPGAQRTAIGITGNQLEVETGTFDEMEGVQEVIRVSKPYKLVSRDLKEEDTVVRFPNSDATFGGEEVAVIAGPCAIESRDQALHVSRSGGGRPEDTGGSPRPLRSADRYRGHR